MSIGSHAYKNVLQRLDARATKRLFFFHTTKPENIAPNFGNNAGSLRIFYLRENSFVFCHIQVFIFDALHGLVPFVQFKERENTHGRVSLLIKLQAKNLQLY